MSGREVEYVTLEDAITINRMTVEAHGGTFGIRDQGLLESALAQPGADVFGQERYPTLPEKAAAYMYHLSQSHPFHDGNKRTALGVTDDFITRNGYRLTLSNEEAERITLETAAGQRSKGELARDLAHSIEPVQEIDRRKEQMRALFAEQPTGHEPQQAEQRREQMQTLFSDGPAAHEPQAEPDREREKSRSL